jgi:hypothetical protein
MRMSAVLTMGYVRRGFRSLRGMNTLFPANPADKQIQEPLRVGGQTNAGVRFQFNDALDFVVVSVENVILV